MAFGDSRRSRVCRDAQGAVQGLAGSGEAFFVMSLRSVLARYLPQDYPQTGWECDEYPFASTQQAASQQGDYSERPMPSEPNKKAGESLWAFYNAWRMLDQIPFRVVIRP